MSKKEVSVYDNKLKEVKKISFDDERLDLPWNDALLHQVIVSYLANERGGLAHSKLRKEVRGGGRKPWKQKGTGRARHGSTRSPLWKGGGVTFGPRNEKIYEQKINKKMKQKALFVVLSQKLRDDSLIFVNSLNLDAPSTKTVSALIKSLREKTNNLKGRVVVVLEKNDRVLQKSFANIPKVETTTISTLNSKLMLNSSFILFLGDPSMLDTLLKK